MKIDVQVVTTKTIEVRELWVDIPADEVDHPDVYEGPGRIPADFRVNDDFYRLVVDVDSGVVRGWPRGLSVNAHFKPRDGGSYRFFDDPDGKPVLSFTDDYVPAFLDHDDGGDDYLSVKIDENGKWIGLNLTADRIMK